MRNYWKLWRQLDQFAKDNVNFVTGELIALDGSSISLFNRLKHAFPNESVNSIIWSMQDRIISIELIIYARLFDVDFNIREVVWKWQK
jgi:hypothetical protein